MLRYRDRMHSGESRLHVIFSRSARASLAQALDTAGRTGEAVAPYDDFSFGPIDSDDAEARDAWVAEALGYSGWGEVSEGSLPILPASAEAGLPPVAWISPDSTQSMTGFLWWLSHQGDRECLVLEVPRLHARPAEALGELLDAARPLPAARKAEYLATWSRLQAENAPLRVLDAHGALVSAPLDHFDAELLGHATAEWQKMSFLVGTQLRAFADSGVYQAGDIVLGARLADLAEAGILEWRGNLDFMGACELRLPG